MKCDRDIKDTIVSIEKKVMNIFFNSLTGKKITLLLKGTKKSR